MKRSSTQAFVPEHTNGKEYASLTEENEVRLVGNNAVPLSPDDIELRLETDLERCNSQSKRTKSCKCNPYSKFTTAGPFVLGLQLNDTQFVDLDQFIGRRIGDSDPNRYYLLKIVKLPMKKENETYSQRQAKLLLYNEFSVLSLLKDQDGVAHHKGLFMDYYHDMDFWESTSNQDDEYSYSPNTGLLLHHPKKSRKVESSEPGKDAAKAAATTSTQSLSIDHASSPSNEGRPMRRLILALECFMPHNYCSTMYSMANLFSKFTTLNSEYENLQEYVKRFKNIPEIKALLIFKKIVNLMYELHKKNIAHRDMRLENVLYNHRSDTIILVNFGLARYVINDSTCICDHRGSSAYISPDVLKRRPYNPKASDCWALGIILYTMLFGKFPFYAESFTELFKKINAGSFTIPSNVLVWKNSHESQPLRTESHTIVISAGTMHMINFLIVTEAKNRMNVYDLRKMLYRLIDSKLKALKNLDGQRLIQSGKVVNDDLQVVPDVDLPEYQNPIIKPQLDMHLDQSGLTVDKLGPLFSKSTRTNIAELLPDSGLIGVGLFPNEARSQTLSATSSDSNDDSLSSNQVPQAIPNLFPHGPISSAIEHLHDHNYSQKGHSPAKSFCNSFKNYLLSSESKSLPRFVSSLYSAQENRFYLKSEPSIYSSEYPKNYTSLLLECEPKQLKSKPILTNGYTGSQHTRGPVNGFVRLGSKKAKSNFSVVKIEGDFRPLNEKELNLVKNFLQ